MTKQHWSKECSDAKKERDQLKHQLAECMKECEEQARLNGIGGSVEAKQLAIVDRFRHVIASAYEELGSYYCNIEQVRNKLKDALQQR